ncbi:FimV/HubP family polar landmark protein, partial [Kaarinaea lacus]
LVDPPVLTAETPAPVEQAATAPVFAQPPKQVQQTRPAPRPQPVQPVRPQPRVATRPVQPSPPPVRRAPPPAPRRVETPTGDVEYGRVKRGDTLYEIARDTRPNESVSINQMMLAYLRDNPEAFVDGNINKLKAGHVLRINDASSIGDTSRREAVSEVRRQNLAWHESRGTRLVKQVEPEGDSRVSSIRDELAADEAAPKSTRKPKAKADGPKVVLAKKASDAEEGSAGSATSEEKESAKVKEDLLVAAEALDANRQEAEELDTRMAELDEQMQSMQRLIMLKDEELLALQNKMGQEEPEQAAAKPEAKPKAKPKAQEPAPEEAGMADELLSDPILLGLAGLLVVAVVGWLVVRRRRMQGGFEESILNVGTGGAVGAAAASATAGGPESAMVSDFVMSDMPGAQGDGSDVDAISEADVYLAYGRHQQAEDILRQALDKTPDQLDLHAKLLEVFHAAKNTDAFEEQAGILHEKIGGDESNSYWMDIVPLGREICPQSELFGGGGSSVMDESLGEVSADEEDLLDFDFDAGLDEADVSESQAAATVDDDSGDALDFDMSSLDFDLDSSEEKQETAAAAEFASMDVATEVEEHATSDDGGLDFDLSFSEDDASSAVEEEPLAMEMDTATEAPGGLDFDLDMESEPAVAEPEEEAPLELSMDLDTEESAIASDDSMSMDFDQGADIVQLDTGGDEIDLDGELDEDIFSNVDEVGTKLDLAKAYVDMGDSDGARSILDEVLEEGDDSQKQQAEDLLAQMG